MTAPETRPQSELERRALELAPVMVRDLDGTIRLWTRGVERLYGFTRQEATGQSAHRLLQTEFPRPLQEINAELLDTGHWAGDLVNRRRDAGLVIVSTQWSLARSGEGSPLAVTEVSADITRLKRDEAARQYLAAIVESSDDAIIGKTLDGVVTSWNRAAETIFGYAAAEIVGQPIAVLFPPDRLVEEAMILERLRRGERLEHYETVRRRKDGTEIEVLLSVSPIRDAQGAVIGISKIARDVSEQKRIDAQMDRLHDELLHVARLSTMGQMASTLAHELNQPLSAIANYLGALRRLLAASDGEHGRLEEIAGKAAEQAARAGEVIRRLRQFVTKGETDRKRHDLNDVVQEAVGLSLVGARQQGITPVVSLASGLPGVLVDRIQIQQVVLNLVRNAIEAMEGEARRELRVETRRADAMAQIIVADSGPGIAPAIAERLFQAFATTKPTGMGIGLSICREIVEAHGGTISAAANRPTGTVFTVALPLAEPE